MSLITGPQWERAVGRHLVAVSKGGEVRCERTPATTDHSGGRLRYTGDGPADFQAWVGDTRCALEIKAWTHGRRSWELVKLAPHQAADLDAADHAAVILRRAPPDAFAPDLVYVLDWAHFGPIWHQITSDTALARGSRSLTEGDLRRIALQGGPSRVRLVQDEHGAWTCPNVLPSLLQGWGLLAPDPLDYPPTPRSVP